MPANVAYFGGYELGKAIVPSETCNNTSPSWKLGTLSTCIGIICNSHCYS